MADTEFEEFRKIFDKLPGHLRTAPSPFYSLVPGLDEESSSHSSKSDSSPSDDGEDDDNRSITPQNLHHAKSPPPHLILQSTTLSSSSAATSYLPLAQHPPSLNNSSEDDEIGDGLRTTIGYGHHRGADASATKTAAGQTTGTSTEYGGGNAVNSPQKHMAVVPVERRRRKLPEIPKNKKPSLVLLCGQTSLADELSGRYTINPNPSLQPTSRSVLAMKCGYLLDEDSSPDSDRLHSSLGDVDSGHSTAHSPSDLKSMSPTHSNPPFAPPPPFGGVPYSQLEMLEATHRALHKFITRHRDEVELEIGDPIYVQKEAEDLWCEGVNLRTGKQGSFPSAYAVDLEYNDFDPETIKMKRERYLLGYLGSVETLAHKGTGVVCQAVKKIIGESGDGSPKAQCCILEISDQGLRMVERSRLQQQHEQSTGPPQQGAAASAIRKGPCIDYFYSLKNVSFCAFHPRDHRYIGFITKHPTVQRFACHVFQGQESTRPVAEAVGRAFQRFYQKFIETAYPIEDIYIE